MIAEAFETMSTEKQSTSEQPTAAFRRPKKRLQSTRTRKLDEDSTSRVVDDEDDGIESARISDIHEAQASRKRRNGLTALECALGKKLASEFDELDDDPFRMRGGGMLQLSEDKKLALAARDIEVGIKEQFRAETLLRDEHEEMKKYIDERINKNESDATPSKQTKLSAEDQILMRAADSLRHYKSKANDELLSNSMLVGIPEVDLGIDVRMRNVLATETRKAALISEQARKKAAAAAAAADEEAVDEHR